VNVGEPPFHISGFATACIVMTCTTTTKPTQWTLKCYCLIYRTKFVAYTSENVQHSTRSPVSHSKNTR